MLEGEFADCAGLVAAIGGISKLGEANVVENLICVPHSQIVRGAGTTRRARIAIACEASGEMVWDACDPPTRACVQESGAKS